jgi:hypothetical protein
MAFDATGKVVCGSVLVSARPRISVATLSALSSLSRRFAAVNAMPVVLP